MIGAVIYSLVPTEPVYEIGEPIWLRIQIENHSAEAVHGTIDTGLKGRTDKLFVTVTDAQGKSLPDAYRFPKGGWANSARTDVTVPAGDSGVFRIDLAKYAWVDAPGTYDVRLLVPIGMGWNDPAPPPTDSRWVRTSVRVVAPTDPVALVASIPKTVDAAFFPRGGGPHIPWMDVNTYDALGHVRYVSILEPLAAASFETEAQRVKRDLEWGSDPLDERALYGLGACPCTEATEALLRLYDHLDTPRLRPLMADELLRRLPRPDRPSTWFVEHAWDPRFAPPLLARARAALDTPAGSGGWTHAYSWAADVIEVLGDPSDGARLVKALDRTLAVPPPSDERPDVRGSVETDLIVALRRFPATPLAVSAKTQLALDLERWDGRTGSPPEYWEGLLLRALASDDPTIVQHALWKVPKPVSPALLPTVLSCVGSPVLGIAMSADDLLVNHASPDAVRELALTLLDTGPPATIAPLLFLLEPMMPRDVWLARVVEELSRDPSNHDLQTLLKSGELWPR